MLSYCIYIKYVLRYMPICLSTESAGISFKRTGWLFDGTVLTVLSNVWLLLPWFAMSNPPSPVPVLHVRAVAPLWLQGGPRHGHVDGLRGRAVQNL